MSATSTVPLSVKWGKETHEVSMVPANGVVALKKMLEDLTGVPHDRMKLMPKSKGLWKGVLKDDFDLGSVDFAGALSKGGGPLQVLLMGSAAKLVAPTTKTVFLEDLPPEEVAKVQEPSGLVNLGNTCYLNSVLQCLRRVPELRQALEGYPTNRSAHLASSAANPLVSSLRDLYARIDRSTAAVPPSQFVMATKMAFPQFAQTGPQGQPMQQDAEEFYSNMLTSMAEEFSGDSAMRSAVPALASASTGDSLGAHNAIDAIFGLKMEETLTCDELAASAAAAVAEENAVRFDLQRKLVCNIQGGSEQQQNQTLASGAPAIDIKYIDEGIRLALEGKIEKHSTALGRNAVHTRTQRIARLPPVLAVQFGRFYWKATPDSRDHAGVKCKIMKPVTFQDTLDLYEFCAEDIKSTLKVYRDRAAKKEEDFVDARLSSETAMDVDVNVDDAEEIAAADDEEAEALEAALAMSMQMEETLPQVGLGLPDEFQGIYELFAVVTHKGRNADGGHYMGWVKSKEGAGDDDDWYVFDDDEVSPCKTEDVLKLKGGGDWHMSYLNFYRAKDSKAEQTAKHAASKAKAKHSEAKK